MFHARIVLEATYDLSRVLALFALSVMKFYFAIEIGLYSLYRKKVIATFKLNKKIVRSRYSFPRKNDDLSRKPSCLENATILFMCFRELCVIFCAVRTRNAIQKNHPKQQ